MEQLENTNTTPSLSREPKTIGKILDISFKFLPKIVSQLLVLIVIVAAVHTTQNSPALKLQLGSFGMILALISIPLAYYLFVAQILLASDAWEGKKIETSNLKGRIRLIHFFRLIWTSIVVSLITMLGLVLLIVPGVIYFANRILTYYIILIEDCTVSEALKKSKFLMTSGPSWYSLSSPIMRISGLAIVVLIISMATSSLTLGGIFLDASGSINTAIATGLIAIGSFATVIAGIYNVCCFVGFYHDLKARYEGADLISSIENLEQ